jgi:hypothetical protein
MFELKSYEVNRQNDKYVIKINIRNNSDHPIDTKIVLSDSIFGKCIRVTHIVFSSKTTHWMSWDLVQDNAPEEERGLQMQALWGPI